MAVKVLITRQFKPEEMSNAHQILKEMRAVVTLREGYITGQTLVSADTPNKTVVIGTWSGQARWDAWRDDPKRKEFSTKLGPLLAAPETIEVFLAGSEA